MSNEARTNEAQGTEVTTPAAVEVKPETKPEAKDNGAPNDKPVAKAAAKGNGKAKSNGSAKAKTANKDVDKPADKEADKPKARTKFAKATVVAVAAQCWWKRTAKSRLATDHKLTEEEVDNLRGSETYREAVMSLMVGQRSDPRVFADWHKTESTKPEWLAGRMGIAEEDVVKMFKAAKDVHAKIVAGDVKAPKYVPSHEGKITEYKVSDEGKITSKRVAAS